MGGDVSKVRFEGAPGGKVKGRVGQHLAEKLLPLEGLVNESDRVVDGGVHAGFLR